MPDALSFIPCPECGAPSAAPFERATTMRRARRVAIAIVIFVTSTLATVAALRPVTALATSFPLTRSHPRATAAISADSLRDIAAARAPTTAVAGVIAANDRKVSAISSDILSLEVSRQRGETYTVTRDNLGRPLPIFQRLQGSVVSIGKRSGIYWYHWNAAAWRWNASLFLFNYAPLAFIVVVWLAADHSCRALTRRKLPRYVILVTALAFVLAPSRATDHFYNATILLPPPNATGSLPHQVRFPYPTTDAEVRALATEVVRAIDRIGTTPLDGNITFRPQLKNARPSHTIYGHPFPILQHTNLTAATTFPAHHLCARISWRTFDLQLPNSANATTRHIFSLDIPALAQLTLLLILIYHAIRLIHYRILKRRHHNRLTKNLCPHCAYPAPKPA